MSGKARPWRHTGRSARNRSIRSRRGVATRFWSKRHDCTGLRIATKVTPATRLEARAEVACAPITAAFGGASPARDGATRALSKREKRKARREQRERELKRPSPPRRPQPAPPIRTPPPSNAVPIPERADVTE
jgi:hypothetical protein